MKENVTKAQVDITTVLMFVKKNLYSDDMNWYKDHTINRAIKLFVFLNINFTGVFNDIKGKLNVNIYTILANIYLIYQLIPIYRTFRM